MPELLGGPSVFPAALLLPGDAFDTDHLQILGRRVAGRYLAQGITAFLNANEALTILVSSSQERERLKVLFEPFLPIGSKLNLVIGIKVVCV